MEKIDWVEMTSKYPGYCLICNHLIEPGTNIFWKRDIGIRHIECGNKYDRLIDLKDEALRHYSIGLRDEGDKIYKQITSLEEELKIHRSLSLSKLGGNNGEALKVLWNSLISKDQLRVKAKNRTYAQFTRAIKKDILSSLRTVFSAEVYDILIDENVDEHLMKMLYDEWKDRNAINLTGETPYKDRQEFKKILQSCRNYIHYIDNYFDLNTLELLLLSIDIERQSLKEIKILTSFTHKRLDKKFKFVFEKLQNELKTLHVDCQMRIITEKNSSNSLHNRYLFTTDGYYDIPSRDYSLFGSVCSISNLTDAKTRIEFQKYWDSNTSVDILKDWDKINVQNDSTQETHCHVCKEVFFPKPWQVTKFGKSLRCPKCVQSRF